MSCFYCVEHVSFSSLDSAKDLHIISTSRKPPQVTATSVLFTPSPSWSKGPKAHLTNLVHARNEPLSLPTYSRQQPPQSPPASALLQTAGSLSPAFPSSPSLRWAGRRTQHGVTGNCLSTQEQDTKTSPAGLPGWISSQEHGFPHE